MASTGEVVTYAELDARSNQLAHLLAARGLGFGDHIALCLENSPRFLEVTWAAQRSGLVYTAINYHLTADEIAYIVNDCDARAFITSTAQAATAAALQNRLPHSLHTRLVIDGALPGFESYERAVADQPTGPVAEEVEGTAMLYSSGTTGRPKGIAFVQPRLAVGTPLPIVEGFARLYGFDDNTVYLSPAPLYHAAPLHFCMTVLRFGGTLIIMERFDPEEALALIERYRVTHSQWVPTMFIRLLKLPAEQRRRHDLSSHRVAIHAAAPCPVPVKEELIDWWGPIVF